MMRALYIQSGEIALCSQSIPVATATEALIRVKLAGICDTDLQLLRGYKGFSGIPGHEFVGEVVECGDRDWIGKRVVGEINVGCGRCELCRQGLERHCAQRSALGIIGRAGAHAEYITLPTQNLHVVADEISDEQAVFVEPLAAACEILEQLHIAPDSDVAVVGDGKLGLLIAQVMARCGARVCVFGHHQEKLARLRDCGVDCYLTAALQPLPITEKSMDTVVECTGTSSGFAVASKLVRPRGTVVVKSTYKAQLAISLADIVVDEIHLLGSRCGPFAPALRMLLRGEIDVTSLISARFPLTQGKQAYHWAARSGVLKIILEM